MNSSGKWVLQKEFVEDSFKQGSWLSEEIYEWTSDALDAGVPRQLAQLYDAPKQWRLAWQNTKTGAFGNWNAIVHIQDNKQKKAYERYNTLEWKQKIHTLRLSFIFEYFL
jgi:hypothetical protein